MTTPEERIAEAGYVLPPPPPSKGMYRTAVRDGDALHLSAHGPFTGDGEFSHVGRIGAILGVDEGRKAAEACGLSLLATARDALDGLASVRSALTMRGYLNAEPSFTEHASVLDGASAVLVAAFGEAGRPVRTAVGVASLPFDLPLVVELSLSLRSAP